MKTKKYRIQYVPRRDKYRIQRRERFLFIPYWSTFSNMGFQFDCDWCSWEYFDTKQAALQRIQEIIQKEKEKQEKIEREIKNNEEFTEEEFIQKYPELNI